VKENKNHRAYHFPQDVLGWTLTDKRQNHSWTSLPRPQ